jgi:hypothetical protein
VHVGQICVHIILKNFNLGLLSVCLLIIVFNIKAAKCLNILTGRLYISRDVLFEETIFPFQNKSTHQSESPSLGPNFPQPIHSRPIFLSFHLQIHYTRQVFLHHTLKFTQNVPSQLFPMLSSSPQPIKLPSSQQNPSQNTHPMLTRTELRTTSPNQKCSKMVILIIQLLML